MRSKGVIIFFSVFFIAVLIVGGCFFYSFKNYSKASIEEANEKTVQSESQVERQIVEKDILTTIHYMANTLIIAEDGHIWGKEKITKDKLESLINEISNSNFTYKNDLLAILNKWKNNDFSTVVDDHNIVWKLLDGTVGRAEKADENAVKEVMAELISN